MNNFTRWLVIGIFIISFLALTIFYIQSNLTSNQVNPITLDLEIQPGRNHLRLIHNDIDRDVFIETPKNFKADKEYPVVFFFHGGGQTGASISMQELINEEQFIGVYPSGISGYWNTGFETSSGRGSTADDIAFVEFIFGYLDSQINVEQDKIFAAGMSMGAIFLNEQILHEPNRFSAAVLFMASFIDCEESNIESTRCLKDYPNGINPDVSISVLTVHGMRDDLVPYNGGVIGECSAERCIIMKSADENIAIWANQNGCDKTPQTSDEIKDITIHEFNGCFNQKQVMFYSLHDAEHGYLDNYLPPGRYSGGTIDLLWQFFKNN